MIAILCIISIYHYHHFYYYSLLCKYVVFLVCFIYLLGAPASLGGGSSRKAAL